MVKKNFKNVLLTGATGGLGKVLAKELVESNHKVFLSATNERKLFNLSKRIAPNCSGYKVTDLTNSDEIIKLVKIAKPDILINCAGIFVVKNIKKTSIKEFDDTFAVNVRAPFILTRECIPIMEKKGWGRIVNIGSSSAYSGFKDTSIYCASKHALLGLSRSCFNELKDKNIRTFCISPGTIKNSMGKRTPNQDYATFIEPKDLSKLIINTISFDGNMIAEEISVNRIKKNN